MINRRTFLAAAAASALPAITSARPNPIRADIEVPPPVAVHTCLIDERYASGRTVGGLLCGAGVDVHAIPKGDVTQVWLRRLGPAWQSGPITVAGLTARPALFCLEQLARGCGLHLVFHAEHVVHAHGRSEHRLLRVAQAADISTRDLELAGLLWPSRIAQVIATHGTRTTHSGRRRIGVSQAGPHPPPPSGAQLLTSWIIAAA
ncbi:MAG TPA: hypothetical protein VGM97_18525 [Steroidobacteraceae bacterium]